MLLSLSWMTMEMVQTLRSDVNVVDFVYQTVVLYLLSSTLPPLLSPPPSSLLLVHLWQSLGCCCYCWSSNWQHLSFLTSLPGCISLMTVQSRCETTDSIHCVSVIQMAMSYHILWLVRKLVALLQHVSSHSNWTPNSNFSSPNDASHSTPIHLRSISHWTYTGSSHSILPNGILDSATHCSFGHFCTAIACYFSA